MTTSRIRLIAGSGAGEFPTAERCHITELVNDPSLPEVSLAQARVEAGVTTELHALDVEEIYIVTAGRGRFEGDGAQFDVGPGDSVVIPAGMSQRITNTGPSDLVFLCLCRPRFVVSGYRALDG